MRRWLARYHAEGRYEVQSTPGGHYRIPARVVAAVKAGTYEDPADARAVA